MAFIIQLLFCDICVTENYSYGELIIYEGINGYMVSVWAATFSYFSNTTSHIAYPDLS
mgnify:CR=1 FL=1